MTTPQQPVTGGTWRTLKEFALSYPRRSLKIVALLVVGGMAEGIGIASLLPLLELSIGGESLGGIGQVIVRGLNVVGLRPTVAVMLSLIVLGIGAKAWLTILAMREAGYASADVATDLRLELIRALMRARWEHFTSQKVGTFANAVSSEAQRAASFYVTACYLFATTLQVLVYVTLAIAVSGWITIVAIGFGGVLFLTMSRFVRVAREGGLRQTEMLQTLISRLTDSIGAIKPLKAMGREEDLLPILEHETRELNEAQRREILGTTVLPGLQEPLIVLFMAIGVYIFLETLGVPFDELIFVAFVFHRMVTRLGSLQVYYQKMVTPESAYWAIRASIRRAHELRETDTGTLEPHLEREIRLEGVDFSYGPMRVLSDFSLTVPVRRLTAIIGPSGSGKTTIIDLIVGLIRPDAGEIWIDDVPLADASLTAWRKRIGYVPQDVFLFHDSIFANVSLNEPDVTREQVEKALRAAEAWEFVSSLPDGMDATVGERGGRISGGQRQRIAIARALVRNPDLLILDEATTALDPVTERAICATLESLKSSVTILAISHQPTIVEVADQVVPLQPHRAESVAQGV